MKPETHNPKQDPNPGSNTQKDPDDWVTGDEPMTGAQASYIKTLSEEAHDPEAFADDLPKAEASKRIDALKEGRADERRSPEYPPLSLCPASSAGPRPPCAS